MKRIAAGLLTVLVITACRPPRNSVGLFLYNLEDPFVYSFSQQIREESRDLFDIQGFDAQNSQIIQNEQIEQLIRKRPDLMMINAVDRLGAYSIIRKLKHEGIPVVFFNREPLNEDLRLWNDAWYVGARAEQSGQMQAELIMDLFGNDPEFLNQYDRNEDGMIQAVILKGEQGHQDAEIRTSEVVRAFKDRGFKLDLLITEVADWKGEEAYEKMGPIIDKYGGRIEVVLSNNDAMAIGAINRMKEQNLFRDTNGDGRIDRDDEAWIPVAGIDGLEEAVSLIEEGYLYGSVLNDSQTQARALVELSEYILGGRSLDDMNFRIEDDMYIWIDYRVFTLE